MSRAFIKETDETFESLPDRPISSHQNLVTPEGLELIEAPLLQKCTSHSSTFDIMKSDPTLGRAKDSQQDINHAAERAGPRQGELPSLLRGRSHDRRPISDRDSPGRTNGNAVANPRIRA